MVYQDFTPQQQKTKSQFRIPPLSDRLLAFVFDVVIFTPVFTFILANLFRKLELMYFISPGSAEFFVLCAVLAVFLLILIVLFQTLFITLMGATPGKYFFKIKVVSLQGPIRFSQAFLRSFVWALEAVCLFLPFCEVLSESLRRPLHDRAAGTMAVTLKKEGDPGPHPFEAQFVRQFLLITSVCALTWSIFFVGHFYKMAMSGEFKKSELEADDFLCASVTQTLKDDDSRLDKALALFLADEISEECLAAEAEFALWIPDDSERTWAYLAKGMLKKADSKLFEAYLEKACEVDESGSACQIARNQAQPQKNQLPSKGQTAAILAVTESFEKGLYEDAEKKFTVLSQEPGFDIFSQSGMVKSLWAQNKLERAKGAFQNVIHQMPKAHNMELAAWVCHEELDRSCSQESIEACEILKKNFTGRKSQIKESFIALALIREKECRQSSQIDYSQFNALFQERKDLWQYTQVISKNSPLDSKAKSALIENLAFRKESVRPAFVRRLAMQHWIANYMTSEEDYLKAAQFLQDKKIKDLSWSKMYASAVQVLIKAKSQKALKMIVNLPSDELISRYSLQVLQVKAHYLAQNYDVARSLLKTLQSQNQGRAPASADSSQLSLDFIRTELERQRGASK